MQPHFTFDTHSGATVEATRVGIEYELTVHTAAGRCIATVRMDETEFRGLYADMQELADWDTDAEDVLVAVTSEIEGNNTKLARRIAEIIGVA